MEDRAFLIWLHERLEHKYNTNPEIDYMWKLRSMIEATPIDKVTPNTCSKSIEELMIDQPVKSHF